MKTFAAAALSAAIFLCGAGAAEAGPYRDKLSQCVARATTEADRTQFVAFVFVAVSAHPAISDVVTIKPEQRDLAARRAAEILTRLMTKDCRKESADVVRYEGIESFTQAFGGFGEGAAESLFSHPAVDAEMSKIERYLDEDAFEDLGREISRPADRPT